MIMKNTPNNTHELTSFLKMSQFISDIPVAWRPISSGSTPNVHYPLSVRAMKSIISFSFHFFVQNDKYNKTLCNAVRAGQQGSKTNNNNTVTLKKSKISAPNCPL